MIQPTSLYIHIPWCIRKCPYCDFNSHKSPAALPEEEYVNALIADLTEDLQDFPSREISSIFIGGGTPSLFSAQAYYQLLTQLKRMLPFQKDLEITLEANPGTVEQERFQDYHQLGINRLSLGIQSFNARHLTTLGRIHDDRQAHCAIETARAAGFTNINIDLMHSLPNQTVEEGLEDLRQAIHYLPAHISWYQLTLEPNTLFYKQRPVLPNEDDMETLEQAGFALLAAQGYQRYEISAFCREGQQSRHNLNYWHFGDYYGIGAGAHSKLTRGNNQQIRRHKQRQPKDFLNPAKSFLVQEEILSPEALIFEFMLNASRLETSIANDLFTERTGLPFTLLEPKLQKAESKGLIKKEGKTWQVTPFGRRYTNDLQELFLS